ncbi:MAG: hypothetical protein ACJAR2_003297 [Ilumatobacter sp.]|jgi:hypothetical protein
MGRSSKSFVAAVLAVAMATSVSAGVRADWGFTYGDAGPLDYSEFLEVASTPGGGALIFGVFSGEFEGLDAGLSNRPFAAVPEF